MATQTSTAKVVFRPFDSDCGLGICRKGCSHRMWICDACSCEGGWGAAPEQLERMAAEHVCPPPKDLLKDRARATAEAARAANRARERQESRDLYFAYMESRKN